MDIEIVNSLRGYIETLYRLNQKLIKLCGFDCFLYDEEGVDLVLDIIHNITRLIPYRKRNGKLKLCNKDGLLDYSDKISYLKNDYNEIIKIHEKTLLKILVIRNKYQHKIHEIYHTRSESGSLMHFAFEFKVGGEKMMIQEKELIDVVMSLNNLFAKILDEVKYYANKEKINRTYIERLSRINFLDFNEMYKSDLLRIIGRNLYSF